VRRPQNLKIDEKKNIIVTTLLFPSRLGPTLTFAVEPSAQKKKYSKKLTKRYKKIITEEFSNNIKKYLRNVGNIHSQD
jgi:hypothetical protein